MTEWQAIPVGLIFGIVIFADFCRVGFLQPEADKGKRGKFTMTENGRSVEWGESVPDAPTSRLELVSCGAIAALQAKHGGRRW